MSTDIEIQNSVLGAFDNLIDKRISSLQTDKTVTATIVQCNNSLTGEYIVSFQGGNMTAYVTDGSAYSKNATVYVLIPEGNFSNKKIIVGYASSAEGDYNITFVSSAINDYNTVGRNPIVSKTDAAFGLHSYYHEDYYLIYQYPDTNYDATASDEENERRRNEIEARNKVTIDTNEFKNYLLDAEAIMIESSFCTRLPKAHKNSKTGLYGLQFILAFKDRNEDDDSFVYKNYSYILDTSNMTGNPYAYTTWTDQYNIFPIDTENFDHIQSIIFYSHDFVTKEDEDLDADANIWCKDLEIYGLQHINEDNGDYRLRVSTPQGATFKDKREDNVLNAVASFKYQNTYLTDTTVFYWFVQDATVVPNSAGYQMYGGTGWRRLRDRENTPTINIYESECRAFENKFLCVAVYHEEIILKSYFTIYNETMKLSIDIVSDLGVKFSFDRGIPILTCQLDGKTENFEEGMAEPRLDSHYNFIWSKINNYNQITTFTKPREALEEEYRQMLDDVEDNQINYNTLTNLKSSIDLMENVEFPKMTSKEQQEINDKGEIVTVTSYKLGNIMQYPMKSVDNYATFRCSVYRYDNEATEENEYFIGAAEITLQNEGSVAPEDYFIIIENGDQVFQYNEYGVAPTSESLTVAPQTVLPLQAHFYDPAGLLINEDTYKVHWIVPYKDTLIDPPMAQLKINPANDRIELFTERIYPMNIVDNFNYQAINNQITCVIEYQNETFMKDTRFSFIKIGDNGTNGTDITAVIAPNSESHILNNDMLTMELDKQGKFKQWNTLQTAADKVLKLNLYQRETKLNTQKSVYWSFAGSSTSSVFKFNDTNNHSSETDIAYEVRNYSQRHQIIKAQTSVPEDVNNTNYFAYYPIPIVQYYNDKYKIHIDTDWTLKQILYNADARNPLYNKNQGVKIRFDRSSDLDGSKSQTIALNQSDKMQQEQLEAFKKIKDEISDVCKDQTRTMQDKINNISKLEEELRAQLYHKEKDSDVIVVDPEIESWISMLNTVTKEVLQQVSNIWKDVSLDKDKKCQEIQDVINEFKLKNYINNNETLGEYYSEDEADTVNDCADAIEIATDQDPELGPYDNKIIVLECIGGAEENTDTAAFKLITEKNIGKDDRDENGQYKATVSKSLGVDRHNELMVYILPEDVYSGQYTNNFIHGIVYSNKQEKNNNNPDCEFWIPIHMMLNTYGLASLNSWDGNHIEINEDNNYILAPQIGAGKKDSDNTFTGIVMGTEERYEAQGNKEGLVEEVGLFGYSKGKQSIFLDAETGNATFGLNEGLYDANDPQAEGRIELRPGGVSSISKWHFDNTSLYSANINGNDLRLKTPNKTEQNDGYLYNNTVYREELPTITIIDENDSNKTTQVKASHSIPHWAQGIMLDSYPAYISVKGKQLTARDNISFGKANTIVYEGDSFELQLDPNNPSLFTVYRHTNSISDTSFKVYGTTAAKNLYVGKEGDTSTKYSTANYNSKGQIISWTMLLNTSKRNTQGTYLFPKQNGTANAWSIRALDGAYANKTIAVDSAELSDDKFLWRREPKVGIDAQGRFYTNALKESATSLNIGKIAAFGSSTDEAKFTGASFEVGSGSTSNYLIKFYTDTDEINNSDGNIYISGSNSLTNEYTRPLKIYGKTFGFYAEDSNTKNLLQQKSNNYIEIEPGHSDEEKKGHVRLQNETSYLIIKANPSGKNYPSKLYLDSNFESTIKGTSTTNISGDVETTYENNYTQNVSSKYLVTKNWGGAANINITQDLTLKTGAKGTDGDKSGFQIATINDTVGKMTIGARNARDIKVNNTNITHTITYNQITTVLGNIKNSAWLILNRGTGSAAASQLVSDSGLDIISKDNIRINTLGAGEGIELNATDQYQAQQNGKTVDLTDPVYLLLKPQDGNGGFTLSSMRGSISTIGSVYNGWNYNITAKQDFNAVSITTGINTKFIGVTGDANASTGLPHYGLYSQRDILVNGTTRAHDFRFENNILANASYNVGAGDVTVAAAGTGNDPATVWGHLSKIYGLLKSLQNWVNTNYVSNTAMSEHLTNINNAISAVNGRVDGVETSINTINNNISSLRSDLDSHDHDDKYASSTHTHKIAASAGENGIYPKVLFQWDTYQIDNKNVSHITSTRNLNDYSTTIPTT